MKLLAALLRPRPRAIAHTGTVTQDTGALNPASPLSDELLWAVVSGAHAKRDRVGGYDGQPEGGATTVADGQGLPALRSPGWGGSGWYFPADGITSAVLGTAWTVAVRLQIASPGIGELDEGDFPKILSIPYRDDDTWSAPFHWGLHMEPIEEQATTARMRVGYAVDGSTFNYSQSPAGFALLDDAEHTYAVRVNSDGTVDWFRDGTLVDSSTWNSTLGAVDLGDAPELIALTRARLTPDEGVRGTMPAAAVWGKALSNQQIADFHSEPWELADVSTEPPVPPTIWAWDVHVTATAGQTTRLDVLANDSGAGLVIDQVTQPSGVEAGTSVAIVDDEDGDGNGNGNDKEELEGSFAPEGYVLAFAQDFDESLQYSETGSGPGDGPIWRTRQFWPFDDSGRKGWSYQAFRVEYFVDDDHPGTGASSPGWKVHHIDDDPDGGKMLRLETRLSTSAEKANLEDYPSNHWALDPSNSSFHENWLPAGPIHVISGMLSSERFLSITHGYVEAKVKYDLGHGHWPGWWLNNFLNTDWRFNEIDVAETPNPDSNHPRHNSIQTFNAHGKKSGSSMVSHKDDSGDFAHSEWHVFAARWDFQGCDFMVDGQVVFSVGTGDGWDPDTWISPMHLIFNIQVGTWGWGHETFYAPDSATTWPGRVYVKWVRAFRHENQQLVLYRSLDAAAIASPPTIGSFTHQTLVIEGTLPDPLPGSTQYILSATQLPGGFVGGTTAGYLKVNSSGELFIDDDDNTLVLGQLGAGAAFKAAVSFDELEHVMRGSLNGATAVEGDYNGIFPSANFAYGHGPNFQGSFGGSLTGLDIYTARIATLAELKSLSE